MLNMRETLAVFTTNRNLLMSFRKLTAVYCQNHVNQLSG